MPAEQPAVAGLPGWRRHVWPIVAIVAATVALLLGIYLAALTRQATRRSASLAAVATAAVWTALAAPIVAAGAKSWLGALLRGGAVADASLIALLVLWLHTPSDPGAGVPFVAVWKMYCMLAVVALAGAAVTRLGTSEARRYALGVLAAGVGLALLATPFWVEGILQDSRYQQAYRTAALAQWWNPFYSLAAAMDFSWNYASRMYNITGIGEDIPGPRVHWYTGVVRWGVAAAVLWCLAGLKAWLASRRNAADLPAYRAR
ncbi:MAG: hypothetical protein ACLFV7_11025 [Phycisphaerae bacterium]